MILAWLSRFNRLYVKHDVLHLLGRSVIGIRLRFKLCDWTINTDEIMEAMWAWCKIKEVINLYLFIASFIRCWGKGRRAQGKEGPPPPKLQPFNKPIHWTNAGLMTHDSMTHGRPIAAVFRIGYVVGSSTAPDDGPALIHHWITIWKILPTATVNSGTPWRVIRKMKDHFTLHIYMRSSAYSFTSSSCA